MRDLATAISLMLVIEGCAVGAGPGCHAGRGGEDRPGAAGPPAYWAACVAAFIGVGLVWLIRAIALRLEVQPARSMPLTTLEAGVMNQGSMILMPNTAVIGLVGHEGPRGQGPGIMSGESSRAPLTSRVW